MLPSCKKRRKSCREIKEYDQKVLLVVLLLRSRMLQHWKAAEAEITTSTAADIQTTTTNGF